MKKEWVENENEMLEKAKEQIGRSGLALAIYIGLMEKLWKKIYEKVGILEKRSGSLMPGGLGLLYSAPSTPLHSTPATSTAPGGGGGGGGGNNDDGDDGDDEVAKFPWREMGVSWKEDGNEMRSGMEGRGILSRF